MTVSVYVAFGDIYANSVITYVIATLNASYAWPNFLYNGQPMDSYNSFKATSCFSATWRRIE